MKAVVMTEPGTVGLLSYEDLPEPTIERPTQIKARLHAAGITPIDTRLRSERTVAEEPAVAKSDPINAVKFSHTMNRGSKRTPLTGGVAKIPQGICRFWVWLACGK